jgi:hypothetical protein
MTIQYSEKKKQQTVKDRKPRSAPKSPMELEAQFKNDCAYAVGRMNEWADKLVKKASGRKYHLSAIEADQVNQAITEMAERIAQATAPKVEGAKPEKKGFAFK